MIGKHALAGVALATLLTGQALAAEDEQGSQQECQRLKDQIDYYTRLRRTGGNTANMEYWQRKRREYQDDYSDRSCKHWRKELD